MEFCIQQGWGMMSHCQELIKHWGGGRVIMSPRDLEVNQLGELSAKLLKINGESLLDPQFYLPNSEHVRLTSHDYWPETYGTEMFWGGTHVEALISRLIKKNTDLKTSEVILPGLFGEVIDDHWVGIHKKIDEIGFKLGQGKLKTLATISLGAEALKNNETVHKLIDQVGTWKSTGVYLMCETPKGEYLTDDVSWLSNLLDLISGFRLSGKRVIAGYSNHQSLLLSCANVNAIASGTFLNVRSFNSSKFEQPPESGGGNRAVWYYCPYSMSEYKLSYLDIAQKSGVLDKLQCKSPFSDKYSRVLFQAPQPSLSDFKEQDAHRHYLDSLNCQVKMFKPKETFDATCDSYLRYLDGVEALINSLASFGVSGEKRDFSKVIQPTKSAIIVLRNTRGPVLKRKWSSLMNATE